MTIWKKPNLTSNNVPGARELSRCEIAAVGGGISAAAGSATPEHIAGHRGEPVPIVYAPIINPFPSPRRLPG